MRTNAHRRSSELATGLVRVGALLTLGLAACGAMETQEQPPAGVPDTPFWYTVGDSALWFELADSLAVVQMRERSLPEAVSEVLYELRDLGWRLTVGRGPALRRPGEDQSLEHRLLQVERVGHAVSPFADRRKFERLFWRVKGNEEPGPLLGLLPGLLPNGEPPAEYFWPSCVGIVWGLKPTAREAEAWLDSLGCTVLTSSQFANAYYVQRAWAVELPAGAGLFKWLRRFNMEERVRLAIPLLAVREPPAVDLRVLRRLPGPDEPEPPEFAKLTPSLKESFYVAHFSGTTQYAVSATGIAVDRNRFQVRIQTTQGSAAADSALLARHQGEIISQSGSRVEAWIPFAAIPALAADTLVDRVDMVKGGP